MESNNNPAKTAASQVAQTSNSINDMDKDQTILHVREETSSLIDNANEWQAKVNEMERRALVAEMRALDAGKRTLDAERKLAVLEEARLRGKVEEAAKVQPLTGIMIPAGSGYGGYDKGR
ncbi:hypothetical protein QC764_405750 [Podospora pseudoanserina]|uniref:Uncharacterized protein n=1 Tax=Podospora pseudoanserina TaxID=2609844 RepID=A0ABR0IB44_9PEZI|nr:hypothetical protein QC764_405750 [Podospora pseudoanserina]